MIRHVLVAGGFPYSTGPTATADLYDTATNSFSPTGNLITARNNQIAFTQLDGSVLVASGFGPLAPATFGALNSAELYNASTGTLGTFQAQPAMIVPRWGATASQQLGGLSGFNASFGTTIVIMGGDANGTAEVYFSGGGPGS